MSKSSLALPDSLVSLLAAADKQKNFPAGTMMSLMQQEIGGQQRFLADPSTAHYPTGRAPNGKKSSAFGPFGILESTGRDPGYGVAPLKDKTLAEQVRFAADYLDGRSKSAGSLNAGLAGYGEGQKYSQQVARRRDGMPTIDPVVQAQTPGEPFVEFQAKAPEPVSAVPQVETSAPVAQAAPPAPPGTSPDAWQEFLNGQRQGQGQPLKVADLNFGAQQAPTQVAAPNFMGALGSLGQNIVPNFASFVPGRRQYNVPT